MSSRSFGSHNGFAVLADDLTGAMDTGTAFARAGLETIVRFSTSPRVEPYVLVLTTDSRAEEPEVAARKVRRTACQLRGRYIYKKIDSTLRGNIGVEIMAALDTLNLAKAVVSPAFPERGRTVVGGRLLLDAKPLEETAFGHDLASPVLTSHVHDLLEGQTGLPTAVIGLSEVERGPRHINQRLVESPERLIVIDAVEPEHLTNIALTLAATDMACLPCGSAGLALALPGAFGYEAERVKMPQLAGHGPVLAVVGSRHETAQRQVAAASKYLKTPVITVQPDELVAPAGRPKGLSQLVQAAVGFINSGRSVIISLVDSRYLPDGEGLAARLLARVVCKAIGRAALCRLYMSGGDIAREISRGLGLTGIRIVGELEPGVVLGETIEGTTGKLNVVAKAGGFGNDLTLTTIIYYLESNERWLENYHC